MHTLCQHYSALEIQFGLQIRPEHFLIEVMENRAPFVDWYRRFSRHSVASTKKDSVLDGMMKRFSTISSVFPTRMGLVGIPTQAIREKPAAQPVTEGSDEIHPHEVSPPQSQADSVDDILDNVVDEIVDDNDSQQDTLSAAGMLGPVDGTGVRSAVLFSELDSEHTEEASNSPVAADVQQQSEEIESSAAKTCTGRWKPSLARSGLLGVLPEGNEEAHGRLDDDLTDLEFLADEEKAAAAATADKPVALNMEFISGIRNSDASFAVTPSVRKVRGSCATANLPPAS